MSGDDKVGAIIFACLFGVIAAVITPWAVLATAAVVVFIAYAPGESDE